MYTHKTTHYTPTDGRSSQQYWWLSFSTTGRVYTSICAERRVYGKATVFDVCPIRHVWEKVHAILIIVLTVYVWYTTVA